MGNRLFGLEAELAVSAIREGRALPTGAVVGALAQVAQRTLAYLPGGGSRMFLASGGLFYVDCGNHPEVATPECTTPSEAVCHLRAGERMVARLASLARDELKAEAVLVCRSNVDYSGATWGCHESILGNSLRHQSPLNRRLILFGSQLLAELFLHRDCCRQTAVDKIAADCKSSFMPSDTI